MHKTQVVVPDLGDVDSVEVIEINVAVGDDVSVDQSVVVVESDKASMDVEATDMGKVVAIHVKEGDQVKGGTVLLDLQSSKPIDGADSKNTSSGSAQTVDAQTPPKARTDSTNTNVKGSTQKVRVLTIPLADIGDVESVEVIEIIVAVGDKVTRAQTLLTVESEKASMDVETHVSGTIKKIHVKEGERVAGGHILVDIESTDIEDTDAGEAKPAPSTRSVTPTQSTTQTLSSASSPRESAVSPLAHSNTGIYAGPAVRKLAREFSIDLHQVRGSGKHGRLLKEDLQEYVRALSKKSTGTALPDLPTVNFSRFGKTHHEKLSKLEQAVGKNMHRNWVNLPHVTQFDNADVTELEQTRRQLKAEAAQRSLKLTPLGFLLRACALILERHQKINASLTNDGQQVVYKDYVHIGMAVDTPAGLVVPVIRDANRKDIWVLSEEITELATKARERKLKTQEMQGGSFTISSLGGIGGIGFTPIINAPEVAILGVSKMHIGPVWDGTQFIPRTLLPLSLSYDHRIINGGDAGRFMTELVELLATPATILKKKKKEKS